MSPNRRDSKRKPPSDLVSRLLRPDVIEGSVRELRIVRTEDGQFRVADMKRFLYFAAKPVEGRTRREVLGKAREVLREDGELVVREHRYVRQELLRGFKQVDEHGRWLLSEKDFAILLERVANKGYGIFGVEAWARQAVGRRRFLRLYGVEVVEDHSSTPENPEWYRTAFESLRRDRRNMLFTASVSIPEHVLRKLGRSNTGSRGT